jgi:hypothetical protein
MKMHCSDTNLSPEDQSALTITPEETHTKPRGTGGNMYKKYHCLECPYGKLLLLNSNSPVLNLCTEIYECVSNFSQ